MACFLGNPCEVEEPEEMVQYDEDTRAEEAEGCQGDERPGGREVLKVDYVAEHRE